MATESLWGEEFSVSEPEMTEILNKLKTKKVVKEKTLEQKLKSKSVSIESKIELIKQNVYKILGKYKENIICIRTYDELVNYFDQAIKKGIISIDTETNNSLDTIQCKLMGLCIYTPGMKSAYVPVNHTNFTIDQNNQIILLDKIENQITEEQINTQLKRLKDNNIKCIFHNATFDIEVLYSTCNEKLMAYWDTMVGAQLLDENELKGLKAQYKLHINPEQDKYDIEHLFQGLQYAIFDPDLFALYAATDSYMTYELYLYQKEQFEKPENKEIYDLLMDIEIPILDVVADMELEGIEVDQEYAKKMSVEYHKKSDEVQSRIDIELANLKPLIDAWRLTPEANAKPQANNGNGRYQYHDASGGPGDTPYWYDTVEKRQVTLAEKTKLKLRNRVGKSKNEQLSDPIELSSPTQFAILLYDILKAPVIDYKTPRGTGASILEELAEQKHIKICELVLEKRAVDILINNFIDKLPEFVKESTGRLHCRFNSCGTQTGRFSSSDPSLQQIPSHDKTVRMMFKARCDKHKVEQDNNCYKVKYTDDVLLVNNEWKKIKDIVIGDKLICDDNSIDIIKNIKVKDDLYYLYV